MSRLEELIQKFCPNGVEYKTIKEIAIDIYRGSGIKRDEITEIGVPCVRYGEIYTTYGVWFEKCVSHTALENVKSPKYFGHGDILFAITGESVEDIAKSTAYIGQEKCLAGGDIVVMKHNQNPKYLAYALSTSELKKQKTMGKVKSKVVHSNIPSIERLRLPVPPLEVQHEIVQILDKFMSLSCELITELTTELRTRKKQYGYYRDKLLYRNANGVFNKVKITEIADTYIGLVTTMTKHYVSDGVLLIHNSDVKNNHFEFSNITFLDEEFAAKNENRRHKKGDVITVHTGDVGTSAIIDDEMEGSLGFATIVSRIKNQDFITPQWLSYYLNSSLCKEQIWKLIKGDRNNLNLKDFNKILISIPPIKEQRRIISALDKFDIICNELTSSLPAEIEARQRQYEYYRDKLLSFKELSP